MRRARAVIGAGYGDEGKGLMVDRLASCSDELPWVVRFNGGAQAGHTVVAPDGRRHIFGHFGSGSFCGAPTFLSRFFAVHPVLFLREHAELAKLGIAPCVLVDRAAPVTTPWDMLVNQGLEAARGAARHGSCGIGFGETIGRHLDARWRVSAGDLADRGALADRLDRIRCDWFPARLAAVGLADPDAAIATLGASDAILERFLDDVATFSAMVEPCDGSALASAPEVLFEGAQGLMLDQDRGCFPHVTRSNTGLRNVIALSREAGLESLDVTYMTRCYVTRHGAGPLAHERQSLPGISVRDPTNVPNDWQGTLRYGLLDVDILRQAIAADLSDVPADLGLRHGVALTCLDQLDGPAIVMSGGAPCTMTGEALVRHVAAEIGASTARASFGPGRGDVVTIAPAASVRLAA